MKKIFGKTLRDKLKAAALAAAMLVVPLAAPAPVMAAGDACNTDNTVLGLRPWWQGLTTETKDANEQSSCVLAAPGDVGKGGISMAVYVWTIVLNLLADLFIIVGLAAIIFVIYGGFQYIMSSGDPGKAASGKQTIVNAMIGLVISLLANVIVNTILNVMAGAAN